MADEAQSLRDRLALRLREGRALGLERRPPLLEASGEGPVARVGGRACLNFLSNDSLGWASCAAWRAEVGACFAAFPPSASASRLAGGRSRIVEEAEAAAAAYFGFDECLFLPSGYQGNQAVAAALIQPGQPVFVDRRLHASFARALPATKGDVRAYAHADCGHLDRRLSAPRPAAQPLVVTESLFSMDGTVPDMAALAALRAKHGFFLMADEAHAVGALGPGGRGLCAALPGTADVVLGTFGTALGLFGSFVLLPAGFTAFFEYLSSPVMHSTAMPPAHAAAVLRLLERLPRMEAERGRLRDNAAFFRSRLAGRGIPSRGGAHIVAVPTGGEAATARLGERLAQRGVLALAARFPTVPRGGGLLRFGVTALHTRAMLEHAAEVLADLWDGGPASGETR